MEIIKSVWDLRYVLRNLAWNRGGDEVARRLFNLVSDPDLPRGLRERVVEELVEYLRRKGYKLAPSVYEHVRERAI